MANETGGDKGAKPDRTPATEKDVDPAIVEIREEVTRIQEVLIRMAQNDAMSMSVANGFAILVEQLAPLRDLTPHRRDLSKEQAESLRNLRLAAERPDWTGAGRLPQVVDRAPLPGEALPPAETAIFIIADQLPTERP